MPVLLLGLLVVLAGLAIGGFAGRLTAMHAHLPTSVPSISPIPTVTPSLAPLATPTPKTTPSPKPTPSPKASPTPKATPSSTPSPMPTSKPSASPSPTERPSPSPTPAIVRTPKPVLHSPRASVEKTARPSPVPSSTIAGSAARALVRVYLADLARGDSTSASALLASGSPDTFIDGTLQMGTVMSVPTADGAQSVTAHIIVGVKHYVMSFLVGERAGHARILSHQASSTIPSPP